MKVTKQVLLSMCLECVKVYDRPGTGCLFIILNNTYYLIQATGDLHPYTEYRTDVRITDNTHLLKLINKQYRYL